MSPQVAQLYCASPETWTGLYLFILKVGTLFCIQGCARAKHWYYKKVTLVFELLGDVFFIIWRLRIARQPRFLTGEPLSFIFLRCQWYIKCHPPPNVSKGRREGLHPNPHSWYPTLLCEFPVAQLNFSFVPFHQSS